MIGVALQWGPPEIIGVALALIVVVALIAVVSAKKPGPAEPPGAVGGDDKSSAVRASVEGNAEAEEPPGEPL
jgi:hypothetical protein